MTKRTFYISLSAGSLLLLAALFLLRYNVSPSIPVGLYLKQKLHGAPERGQYVIACLAPKAARVALRRGYLPRQRLAADCGEFSEAHVGSVAKRVLAAPGDTVKLDSSGLYVEGRRISGTPPTRDRHGRPVQPLYGFHVVPPNHYWLGSPARKAYDSRYFGPASRRQLIGRLRPLWTRETTQDLSADATRRDARV